MNFSLLTSTALDVVLYGANFEGMKLAGMILIAVGFFLVMFPDNWPDYITRLLRYVTISVIKLKLQILYKISFFFVNFDTEYFNFLIQRSASTKERFVLH